MHQNWLNPTKVVEQYSKDWKEVHLGHSVRFFQVGQSLNMTDTKVAILGIGASGADEARKYLYQMSNHFSGLSIVDLGNFKKKEIAFVIPLLKELLEANIIPVLLGDDISLFKAQYRSFKFLKEAINVAIIDKSVSISSADATTFPYYLDDVFYQYHENIFHLDIIGHQMHYSAPFALDLLKKHHFGMLRQGEAKANMELTEPIIRDADLFSFNISGIKQAAAPSQKAPSSSGFTSEEACRICRYAGMSDKLRSFGIFGYQKSTINHDPTPETIAQMIWYFLFGVFHRKNDFPVSTTGMLEYVVQLQHQNFTFWKSSKSERWWLQMDVKPNEKNKRHRLIPCTYGDYQAACNGHIPDRILHAIRRFV